MVEVGIDLWRSPCPNLVLKQGHLEPVSILSILYSDYFGF